MPQPGPFEAWISGRPSSSTSSTDHATTANAVAAGSMPSTFQVFFFTLDSPKRQDRDGGRLVQRRVRRTGQVVTTVGGTVPADGYVAFNCPGYAEQHVSGRVRNTTTSEINGGHHLSYWQARYFQCGDTIPVQGARHYYLPWKNLDYSIPRIESHFGHNRSRVTFIYDDDDSSSAYRSGDDEIVFRQGGVDRDWTAATRVRTRPAPFRPRRNVGLRMP